MMVRETFEGVKDFQRGHDFEKLWQNIVLKMWGAKFKKIVFFCTRKGGKLNGMEWDEIEWNE